VWTLFPVFSFFFSVEMGSQKFFGLGCPQTVILLISVSQVARIPGVGHWHLASSRDLNKTWVSGTVDCLVAEVL
jgi:hypothetical protein